MNFKKSFLALTVATAILGIGVVMVGKADAKGPGQAFHESYQMLTPEKQAQLDLLVKEFADKTAPLRDKLAVKRIELKTLGSNPNVDPKVVTKLAEEVVALRNQIGQERMAMSEKVAKDIGIRMPGGPRMMMGGMDGPGAFMCPGMEDGPHKMHQGEGAAGHDPHAGHAGHGTAQ